MTNFNDYQLTLLERAIEEEATKDIRMHDMMSRETAELYSWYNKYPEDKIAFAALLTMLDWWGIYFSCGYEAAQEIHKKIHEKEFAAAKARFKH